MKKHILFFPLVAFVCSSCTTATPPKLTEAIPLKIGGIYRGAADLEGDAMHVTLHDVDTAQLTEYRNVKPLTGGSRILVYFDTDPENLAAEYCIFIYAEKISFRKSKEEGWYSQELTTLEYVVEDGDLTFDLPLEYFDYKPFKAWSFKTN